MEEIAKRIKDLFREKTNIIITLLLLIFASNVYQIVVENTHYTGLRKKVDHRYFNLSRSLEDIHNVEINTHKGEVKKFRH